tara:strand:+ start:1984 stop:2394 length:411 start_codon:yes stop_codon:yes gene_type:complete
MKKLFYSYSKEICGSHPITEDISNFYFEILKTEYGEEFLNFLAQIELQSHVQPLHEGQNEKFKSIILYLWFSSELVQDNEVSDFLDPNQKKFIKRQEYKTSSPVGYYSALIWPSIKAHPIGLTGGYFGHWKYIPEN